MKRFDDGGGSRSAPHHGKNDNNNNNVVKSYTLSLYNKKNQRGSEDVVMMIVDGFL